MGSIVTPAPVRNADRDTLLKELITAIMQAEAIPDLILGSTILKKVYICVAPRLLAASSTEKSKLLKLAVTTRMMYGMDRMVWPTRRLATTGRWYWFTTYRSITKPSTITGISTGERKRDWMASFPFMGYRFRA